MKKNSDLPSGVYHHLGSGKPYIAKITIHLGYHATIEDGKEVVEYAKNQITQVKEMLMKSQLPKIKEIIKMPNGREDCA